MGSTAGRRPSMGPGYVFGASVALVAGAGVAAAPVVSTVGAAVGAVMMVLVARARDARALGLLAATIGALFSFRGTDNATTVEVIFLAVVLAGALGGMLTTERKRYRGIPVAVCAGVSAVALAGVVGTTAGHSLDDVARDAAPYILVFTFPLLALVMNPRWKGVNLIAGITAVLAYMSFLLTWLAHRGLLAEIDVATWVLPSFIILVATVAYLSVRMIDGFGLPILPVGLFVVMVMGLVLTGTRVSLLLLLGPGIAALTSPRGSRRWRNVVRAGGLLVVFSGIVLIVARAYIPEPAVELLQSRAEAAREVLVGDVSADQSAVARMAATRSALDAFGDRPVVGSGLGVSFNFVSPFGRERLSHSDFTIDSSVATLAKFGLPGTLLLVGSLLGLAGRLIPGGTETQRVAVVFGLMVLAYSPFIPFLEDKGMGVVLLLLVTRGRAEWRERGLRQRDD